MQLIVLFLLVLAWWRMEFRPNRTSNGIGSLVLGCAVFGYGVVNLTSWEQILSGSIVAVGLLIALMGAARYVIHELR